MSNNTANYTLDELNKEATIGGMGEEVSRTVPIIDLSDFDNRKAEIAEELWQASTKMGFFQVKNHAMSLEDIDNAFAYAQKFFDLSQDIKAKYPLKDGSNAGWEYKAQVRPSTGTPDNKESYQITLSRQENLWPSEEELSGFKAAMLKFEKQNWQVGMQILSCFALKLGFEDDFFTKAHNPASDQYQSTLRLIHYLGMENAKPEDFNFWRAGAHSDFDCLTLLHQRPGQGGLQVCPGKELESQQWTSVEPMAGVITCNIGDMLMRWSDDELLSTLHRVRMPRQDEYLGPRLSIPFFCQANKDAIIQGPRKKYAKITAHNYLQERIKANYSKK